jgi:hypothetical protein
MSAADIIPVTSQDASTAQSNYQTAQGAANTSSEADLTLPQLLQQSLSTQAFPTNDPMVKQQGTDLANYQQVLQNGATDPSNRTVTLPNGASVPLGGDAQLTAMSDQEKNAAAPVNMDNLLLALRGEGFSTVLKNIAASHAQESQKLVDNANTAYQTWQTTLNALSQKAQLAQSADQFSQQMDLENKKFQEGVTEFQKGPGQLGIKASGQLPADAQKYSSFNDLLNSYMTNPTYTAAQGSDANAAQSVLAAFMKAHPNYKLTPTEIANFTNYGGKTTEAGAKVGAQFGLLTDNLNPFNGNHPAAVTRGKQPGAIENLFGLLQHAAQGKWSL